MQFRANGVKVFRPQTSSAFVVDVRFYCLAFRINKKFSGLSRNARLAQKRCRLNARLSVQVYLYLYSFSKRLFDWIISPNWSLIKEGLSHVNKQREFQLTINTVFKFYKNVCCPFLKFFIFQNDACLFSPLEFRLNFS